MTYLILLLYIRNTQHWRLFVSFSIIIALFCCTSEKHNRERLLCLFCFYICYIAYLVVLQKCTTLKFVCLFCLHFSFIFGMLVYLDALQTYTTLLSMLVYFLCKLFSCAVRQKCTIYDLYICDMNYTGITFISGLYFSVYLEGLLLAAETSDLRKSSPLHSDMPEAWKVIKSPSLVRT